MYIFVHYTYRSLSLYRFIGYRQPGRMLGYRFRLYPSREAEKRLERHLELCLWLYNRLLSELNSAREKGMNVLNETNETMRSPHRENIGGGNVAVRTGNNLTELSFVAAKRQFTRVHKPAGLTLDGTSHVCTMSAEKTWMRTVHTCALRMPNWGRSAGNYNALVSSL
jgi:hypothetical protein